MGSPPFALSIHNFVSSVGADAGFASIIGLAILVLLYFAHARETSALRQQASELAGRLEDAEARLVQAMRMGAAAVQPATGTPAQPAPQSVVAPAPRPAVLALAPSAPAGVGAPALAAATRFVPLARSVSLPPVPASPAPAGAPVPAAAAAPVQPTPAAFPTAGPPPAAPALPRPITAAVPAPSTAAGAASATAAPVPTSNGGGHDVPPDLPAQPRQAPLRQTPPPVRRIGQASRGDRGFQPITPPARERSRAGRMGVFIVGSIVLAGAIAALLIATSSGGSPKASRGGTAAATNAPSATRRTAPPFSPASVTVAVLNGTATNYLAHRVSARLAADGYRQGKIATASDQTMTATTVAYLPGFRTDALHVARSLNLGPASVQPVDQPTQQVACPGTGTCAANVVVTVGADLATS